MTNSNDPDQIRREIEQTRRDLARNVDALTDQVQPGNMVRREANRVGDSIRGLADRVMGRDDSHDARYDGRHQEVYGRGYADTYGYGDERSTGDKLADKRDELMSAAGDRKDELAARAGDLGDQARAKFADAQGAVQGAPAMARRQTQGNPLGAGLVAFAVGALVGGLIPSSEKERQASVALKEKAQPLVDEAKQVAQEMGENLKPQVQSAVEGVKAHAQESAETLKAHGQMAAEDVKASAQDSAATVKGSAMDAKDEVQASRNNEF